MQIGSSNSLSAQLKALENAALGQYQSNQDFSLLVQQAGGGTSADQSSSTDSSADSSSSTDSSSSSSSSGGYQLSGTFSGSSVIAVGTMSNGQLVPFSQAQIQSEEAAVATARQNAYANALQNFMTLSEAGGQLGTTTFTDKEQFTADNGLVGGNFDTSLSLKPVGGGVPST